jgi:hypothetical protein
MERPKHEAGSQNDPAPHRCEQSREAACWPHGVEPQSPFPCENGFPRAQQQQGSDRHRHERSGHPKLEEPGVKKDYGEDTKCKWHPIRPNLRAAAGLAETTTRV